MSGWREHGPEIFPVDSSVPAFESWPPPGISGTIRAGSHTGKPVLARRLQFRNSEGDTTYVLWIGAEAPLLDSDSEFAIESDTIDDSHLDGTGGLIDYVTTGLKVQWSTDPAAFERAAEHFPGSASWFDFDTAS